MRFKARACFFRVIGVVGLGLLILLIYRHRLFITPKMKTSEEYSIMFSSRQNHSSLKDFHDQTRHTVADLDSRESRSWSSLKYLIKIPDHRFYMYSAVGTKWLSRQHNDTGDLRESVFKYIVITGWQHIDLIYSLFNCCVMLENNTVQRTLSWRLNKKFGKILTSASYACPLSIRYNDVRGVSIVLNNASCPTNMSAYIEPFFPKPVKNDGLVICSKLAYGQQNLIALTEWFEIQRYLGVAKILVNVHIPSINPESIPLFEYYQSIGLAWLLPYDIPEKDRIPRALRDKKMQVYADKRVAILDCQTRVLDFKYFAVIDKDEILLPSPPVKEAIKTYLDLELAGQPRAAGMHFMTQLHLSSWNDSVTNQRQFFANYRQCSKPTNDRTKNVVMLRRHEVSQIFTHSYSPSPGYKRLRADPTKAVIHHYRPPRDSYTGVKGPLKPEGECDQIYNLVKQLQGNVEKVMKLLKL